MSAPVGAADGVTRLVAPAHWRAIEFLSDLHLSETTPRTFDAVAAHLFGTDADAVFVLGDLFEVWIGDDTRGQPFESRCVELLRQAGRHRTIGFMAGNRDFLVGPAMLADCGAVRLNDPTVLEAFGQRLVLTHGDALCLEDVDYQAFRREVRGAAWQQAFLARPVDERARFARAIRAESQARKDGAPPTMVWADVDRAAALDLLVAVQAGAMVHGHTHRPAEHALDATHRRLVLSDWDGEATPPRADVIRLDAAGLQRRAPVAPR